MKKRRQADFQKQKLRVGKTLPRGTNVTNTSFKAKKIITRDHTKSSGGTKTLKEMLTNLVCTKVVQKVESLHIMKKFIIEHRDTLPLYFSDVLKKVGSILLEDNKQVRLLAIEVLNTCLGFLSDQQFKSFFTSVSTYLHCMMTHLNFALKQDSLKFLDILLHTHPDVICNSSKVLNCLLNLISWVDKGEKRGKKKRKLMDLMRNNMVANEWRLEVLVRVLMFLQALAKKQEVIEEEEDREVHWDGKGPLAVPLYFNSGLKPAKLVYPSHVDLTMDLIDYRDFQTFLQELVPLLSEALKGEVPESEVAASEGFHIFDSYVINHLNIIAQILCCIGESINKTSNHADDLDLNFSLEIKHIISNQLLKNFPYAQHDEKASPSMKKQGRKKSHSECMQLNLAVCYLYSIFFLEPARNGPHHMDSQNAAMEAGKPILRYVGNVFGASGKLCPKSLSLLLKACKNLMKSHISPSYKSGILLGMYDILEDRKFSSSAKLLNSFFMELSLNFEFKYLLNTEGMSTWFKLLIKELGIMKESNVIDKTFLKYVSQVCARRYSHFMELLNELAPAKLLEYLKYDNEDFQLTIVHLIVALDNISPDFLQDLAETLRQDSFSSKTAVRLINLLHTRYSRPNLSETDQIFFVKFLLNLGCDTLSIGEQYPVKSVSLSNALANIQQSLQYELCPSGRWERHGAIFKACIESLVFYSEKEKIAECIMVFLKSILLHHSKLYIHSAIAFLELRKRISYCYQDEHLPSMFHELIFSSLVYISVIINKTPEEELGLYSVPELQRSLTDSMSEGPEILTIVENNLFNFSENDLYHILRILMFLIQNKIIGEDERNPIYVVLDKMSNVCTQSKMLNPMWTTICKVCGFL